MTSPSPAVEKLLAGVKDLTVKVDQNAQAMTIARLHADQLTRSSRRHRLAIGLTVLGLVADIVMSILIIVSYRRASCVQDNLVQRQTYNERNFQAEYAKVSGQIKGIDELYKDPRTGVEQFKTASQSYLDKIAAIHNDQLKHPAGHCS